jgi:hypothetical protein
LYINTWHISHIDPLPAELAFLTVKAATSPAVVIGISSSIDSNGKSGAANTIPSNSVEKTKAKPVSDIRQNMTENIKLF